MELYWRLPVRFQEAALGLYASRLEKIYYGRGYDEAKEWLNDLKSWQSEKIEEWRNDRVRYIVDLAAKKVPYYQDAFRKRDWRNVRSASGLHLLPILDKQSVRQNENSFIAEGNDPKALWVQKTSGTSGTSLKIYWPIGDGSSVVGHYGGDGPICCRGDAGNAQGDGRRASGHSW